MNIKGFDRIAEPQADIWSLPFNSAGVLLCGHQGLKILHHPCAGLSKVIRCYMGIHGQNERPQRITEEVRGKG